MGPPSHQVVPERKKKKWKKDKEKKYRRNYLERKLLLSHPWGASRFRENYFSPSKIFQDENKNYRLQQNHSPRTYFSHLRKIISTFPRVLLSEIYIYMYIRIPRRLFMDEISKGGGKVFGWNSGGTSLENSFTRKCVRISVPAWIPGCLGDYSPRTSRNTPVDYLSKLLSI